MPDMSRSGFRGGQMIPIMEAVITAPILMHADSSRVGRTIRRIVRDALKEELLFHHKKRIPEHFNKWRQRKYRYQPRSPRVRLIKQRRNQADLVKSGRSKRKATNQIRITFPRGAGRGVFIRGTMKWPTGFRGSSTGRGVTQAVMEDEITRWTLQEERVATTHIGDSVTERLRRTLSNRAKFKLQRAGVRF